MTRRYLYAAADLRKITAVYLHFIKKKSMMLNVFLYLNKEEKWKQTTG